jgi:hypothetical protein
VGYSDTSKEYGIYVPRKKFIEVNRDVTFHEEATFRRPREIPCDTKKARISKTFRFTTSDEQREDSIEPSMDPIRDYVEFPLEKPPVKRKSVWCCEILKEAKKHATPKGTFRESKETRQILKLDSSVESCD